MFGRELVEQVQADSRGDDRQVPIIVDKCIQAVEAVGKMPVSTTECTSNINGSP